MKNLILLFVALSFAAPTFARGQKGVHNRQQHQEARIEQGRQSGNLTPRESQRLENQQRHINNVEERALADGKLSKKEKRHIDHLQDKANRDIYREKHDSQKRK